MRKIELKHKDFFTLQQGRKMNGVAVEIKKLIIRVYGDPCLRRVSVPVKNIGSAERVLIKGMIETMKTDGGIGLAAPQVGVNKQIIVIDIGDGPVAMINPEIKEHGEVEAMEEGCLSLPGIQVDVRRPREVSVKYLDDQGKENEQSFSDLFARVILHENDHLIGKMIVDYVGWRRKIQMRKQLRDLRYMSQSILKKIEQEGG